ncbi:hypothetical protein COO60DRAFT_1623935 [Scenedesmus sp. NREL 46B-D3]|nr:hypothetical protein COO60DRAFT_1623935 [Scenedesmus sp. NREL 46B-D3]
MGSDQPKTTVLYDVANSPFIDLGSPFTLWEGVKMALLLPTVPLRLCICVTSIILVAIANSVAIAGCDLSKPLPRWRRRLVEISSQTASGTCLRAVGFWNPRVLNGHHYTKGQQIGAIGIFNHVSYLDAFVVVWAFCCAGVTFNFSKHLPILGYGVRALQNLYVPEHTDRASQQKGMVTLIKERANNPSMPMLSVAPEGTVSNGRCLLSFKTGAFVAGTPVVPILLRYKLAPFNPSWSIIIPAWHLLRLMCQFSNAVTVEMLPPYIPSADEKADPVLYAANIRKLIADALGVPVVDQDRGHFLALVKAGVAVSWDGTRLLAPPGVLDDSGCMDLQPHLLANKAKKQQ